jgi:hypothetical protein
LSYRPESAWKIIVRSFEGTCASSLPGRNFVTLKRTVVAPVVLEGGGIIAFIIAGRWFPYEAAKDSCMAVFVLGVAWFAWYNHMSGVVPVAKRASLVSAMVVGWLYLLGATVFTGVNKDLWWDTGQFWFSMLCEIGILCAVHILGAFIFLALRRAWGRFFGRGA